VREAFPLARSTLLAFSFVVVCAGAASGQEPRSPRHCDDGRDELADIVCAVGRPASSVPLACEARPLSACSMTAPAFISYSCFGDAARTTDRIGLAWASGEMTAQPALGAQGAARIEAVERRVDVPERSFSAWWRTTTARFAALSCERGRESTSETSRNVYFLCGGVEIWLYAYRETSAVSVTARASSTPYADCFERATHGRIEPRFGPEPENLFELAIPVLERRCRRRDGAACAELAGRHLSSRAAPGTSPARGVQFAEQACSLGAVNGCTSLGYAYDEGRGVPRDYARARAIYEDTCSRGSSGACARLAQMYERALGVTADPATATSYYGRACALDDGYSCGLYGRRVRDGVGAPRDRAAARAAFDRGCAARDGASCLDICSVSPDHAGCESVMRVLEAACTRGERDACTRLCELSEESPCTR
jgi:TPR repeat protein